MTKEKDSTKIVPFRKLEPWEQRAYIESLLADARADVEHLVKTPPSLEHPGVGIAIKIHTDQIAKGMQALQQLKNEYTPKQLEYPDNVGSDRWS